jgi:iron(III) transport system ATP-binding protein
MTARASSVLDLRNVAHAYGGLRALDDVSLSVEAGEIVCLMGPSGCGKSTLLRLAAGLEPLQAGEIRIDGTRVAAPGVAAVPPDRRGIGFMFQDYALFPHLTVAENVAFGLRGQPSAPRRAAALAALERVNMTGYAGAYPHTLSGGQQQRVALARALAPAPRLLLLDEPFSGLDARLRHRLAEQTWSLLKETGTATIVVTHDPEEGLYLGDRVGILRAGRLEQIDAPGPLWDAPNSAFVTTFLSDVNRLAGVVDSDGAVATPIGVVSAGDLTPGTPVDILARQEGVVVDGSADDPAAARGQVVRSRPLGGRTLVLFRLDGPDGGTTVYGRTGSRQRLAEGQSVALRLDPGQVFVFPRQNAK